MLGIILLTLVAGGLAAPTTAPGASTTLDLVAVITDSFNNLDVDNNGQVELSEFYTVFDRFDTNKDHEMSLQEYIANTNATQSIAKLVYSFFDMDHDDKIDRAETNDIFKLYDTNKNGVITIQEFITEYTKIYDRILVSLFSTTLPPTSSS